MGGKISPAYVYIILHEVRDRLEDIFTCGGVKNETPHMSGEILSYFFDVEVLQCTTFSCVLQNKMQKGSTLEHPQLEKFPPLL
jgi:hypothetical protein